MAKPQMFLFWWSQQRDLSDREINTLTRDILVNSLMPIKRPHTKKYQQRSKQMYMTGVEISPNNFGMEDGPTHDLLELLTSSPSSRAMDVGDSYILTISRKTNKYIKLFTYDPTEDKWKSNSVLLLILVYLLSLSERKTYRNRNIEHEMYNHITARKDITELSAYFIRDGRPATIIYTRKNDEKKDNQNKMFPRRPNHLRLREKKRIYQTGQERQPRNVGNQGNSRRNDNQRRKKSPKRRNKGSTHKRSVDSIQALELNESITA